MEITGTDAGLIAELAAAAAAAGLDAFRFRTTVRLRTAVPVTRSPDAMDLAAGNAEMLSFRFR